MPVDTFVGDLRFGARELLRNKGFGVTAVLSLALGIMAATAMYSVIYGVVLEPFPYKDVDNLVSIALRNPAQRGWRSNYSIEEYAELARRSTVFDGVGGSTISDVLWMTNGEPMRLRGNHISHNGFDVMGVPAALGRTVSGLEENPETKAVLGYRFWVRQFGGDPGVLGTTLVLNGRPRTIVGVMPPRFMFRGADVYLPLDYRTGEAQEGVTSIQVTARRKPAITAEQATADLEPILKDLEKRFPSSYPPKWRVDLPNFKETFPSDIRGVLWVMFGAVGLLLLIACANVSSLLLARASTRQREIAMRAALGASRSRLFRQLFTESLLLGVMGGALGIAMSWIGLKAILAIVPPNVIPDEAEVVLNLPVMLFSFALCLVTTLIFGFAPALHAAGGELAHPLRESGRANTGSRRMAWMRSSLVVAELTLAVILLSCAGLSLRTLVKVYQAPKVVEITNRLTMRLPLSRERYPSTERRSTFIDQLLPRVEALPGVLGVAINSGLHPLGGWAFTVEVPGSAKKDSRPVSFHQVNAGYLKATGIEMHRGRWLDKADIASRRQITVVNETLVKRFFPEGNPLGRTLRIERLSGSPFGLADPQFEIVGVAEDALTDLVDGQPRPEMYVPYSITGMAATLVVHTVGDPMVMAPHIRRQVYELDSQQFVDETRTLEDLMDRFVYSRGRFSLWLMGVFATLGLVLSVIGVYGLLSQVVVVQQQEFGVRMAVGADFVDIAWLVLRRGITLVVAGLAFGIGVTLVLLRQYGKLLEVSDPLDPASLAGACLVLCGAAVAASLIPALRAGRTDPVQALR